MENITTMASQGIKRRVDALTEIREKLESLSTLRSKCCIYRVPKKLREINSKASTPQVVSIGPFHHGEKHLQVMEENKLRYLQTFHKRTGRSLEYCFELLRNREEEARHCYAKTIELSSDEFVKIMLVDGSFLVECLLRFAFPQFIYESDRLFHKPWMSRDVREDMLLLENQLPFFVLEGLFSLISVSIQEETPSFLELVHRCFKSTSIMGELPKIDSNPGIQHLVDFIRRSCLKSFPEEQCEDSKRYTYPPTMSELHEAGIKFKVKKTCSLFDMKFTNGILEIPQLQIYGEMETIIRNLIAFEDCHCDSTYVIHYMKLLYDMIKTSKDVDLLIHYRILGGVVSSREVILRMFQNITTGASTHGKFYSSRLSENLNTYCRTPLNRLKATLKRDYSTLYSTLHGKFSLLFLHF